MKEYPSIARDFQEIPNAYIFDKLDGQNIRIAYARKKGWTKFGSRHRLFDDSDPLFGPAKTLFLKTIADPLARILHDARIQEGIVFCEYWGRKSFCGIHEEGDPMYMTLIDASLDKKGFVDPGDFLKMFGKDNLEIAHLIGRFNWTRGFIDRVWNGELEGVSFEGVVSKLGANTKRVMGKAKTKIWIQRIRERYNEKEAEKLINS